ncbi:MAG: hypothetical protein ACOY82_06920 [Pseudomonadota bacterium]
MANITVKRVPWASGLALAMAVGTASAQDASAPAAPEAPAITQEAVLTTVDASARLVVYRIHAYPTMRTPKVMVNDRLMFRPKQRTYAEMDLPAGRHDIVVDWSGDTGWPDLSFAIDIAPGETKYLQIGGSYTHGPVTGMGTFEYEAGSMAFEVDAGKGAEDIRTCCKRLPTR